MKTHFPYKWRIKDGYPAEGIEYHGNTVFSCFACGGGSTMGYKLAGFNVLGCNEIDPKMMLAYKTNHNPKYSALEPIQTFKSRNDFPDELYDLDILDGSPPCSSFSMSGNRKKDWGKSKKFREGQSEQVLDNLFFDFIDLAGMLRPKVVVAENVKGILYGDAIKYVRKIYTEFDKIGYYCKHYILDASKMGVPQKRERVFFICLRKDLANPFLRQVDFFTSIPYINLNFNQQKIPFKEIEDRNDTSTYKCKGVEYWKKVKPGESFSKAHPKGHFFNWSKTHPLKPIKTISGDHGRAGDWHYYIQRPLNNNELALGGTFPLDYNYCENKVGYLVGMSVPPVMMANIANEIQKQWLNMINKKYLLKAS